MDDPNHGEKPGIPYVHTEKKEGHENNFAADPAGVKPKTFCTEPLDHHHHVAAVNT
jgi:hypothetical protein